MATKKSSVIGELRSQFSIGQEASDDLDYLVGRHQKVDGTAATSRSDVLRDLIYRATSDIKKTGSKATRKPA